MEISSHSLKIVFFRYLHSGSGIAINVEWLFKQMEWMRMSLNVESAFGRSSAGALESWAMAKSIGGICKLTSCDRRTWTLKGGRGTKEGAALAMWIIQDKVCIVTSNNSPFRMKTTRGIAVSFWWWVSRKYYQSVRRRIKVLKAPRPGTTGRGRVNNM